MQEKYAKNIIPQISNSVLNGRGRKCVWEHDYILISKLLEAGKVKVTFAETSTAALTEHIPQFA